MRMALSLLLLALPACGGDGCDPGNTDGGAVDPQGVLEVVVPVAITPDEGSLQVRLEDLSAPLRAVQVDMQLSGAQAVEAGPAGDVAHDVIEAALDQPRSSFTLVVSDSRRVPLAAGPIATITTDGEVSDVALSRAIAVDVDGNRYELDVQVQR